MNAEDPDGKLERIYAPNDDQLLVLFSNRADQASGEGHYWHFAERPEERVSLLGASIRRLSS